MQFFHSEDPKALTKRSELELFVILREADIVFEYQKHLPFSGCELGSETKYCFIDFAIHYSWGVVFLENDEHQHEAQDPSCDVRRDFDAVASVALGSGQKVVFLRFNPDAFRVGGFTKRTPKKERYGALLDLLIAWQTVEPAPEKEFARFFMYYSRDSDLATLPSVASSWAQAAREVSGVI